MSPLSRLFPQRAGRGKRPRKGRAASVLTAGLLGVALLVSACAPSNSTNAPNSSPSAAPTASIPANLRAFYTQNLEWKNCSDSSLECSNLNVPMDYAHPEGQQIQLALAREKPSGTNKPSLVINPGGPGGSGVDTLIQASGRITTARLRDAYTLVSFDPRGVKRSAPVKCYDAKQMDEFREMSADPDTAEGMAQMRKATGDFAAACAKNTGAVLQFVDTQSAAKDMDVLRSALQEQKFNYLGFSYGTFLGATYAGLFPKNVGRMVLDGAVDPALNEEQMTQGTVEGFTAAFKTYLKDCLSKAGCPVSGTVDEAMSQIGDVLDQADTHPLTASDGRVVDGAGLVNGLIVPLYSKEMWPLLTQALTQIIQGSKPDVALALSDSIADREQNGTYNGNTIEANTAINCLDYPATSDDQEMRSEAKGLDQESPKFGEYFAYSEVTCQQWPYKSTRTPAPISADGAPPILVVGTTGDPATPYPWAQSLAKELSSATLLTYNGEGHTAYGSANSCLNNAVDDYLIEGKVPAKGQQC